MNKELMISIQPKHLVNILNGYKTLELRKTVPKDFKGWVYIYCTKGIKDILHKYKDKYYTNHYLTFTDSVEVLNSKVVARFWFDDYEGIDYQRKVLSENSYETIDRQIIMRVMGTVKYILNDDILDKLCLTYDEVENYGKGKDLYAWHIKKLEIFDTPLSLSDFYKQITYPNGEIITPNICEYSPFDYDDDLNTCLKSFELKKAPRSWQYVYRIEQIKENEKYGKVQSWR